jgi:DNA relaxase NicK
MKKVKMHVHSCKVTAAGVDWLTCTGATILSREDLWRHGLRLLHASKREGEKSSAWHANGYIGWKGPHFGFGSRGDSVCLQLSSLQADDEWHHCIAASENVTRLDLAVDCYFEPPVPALSLKVYRNAGHRPSLNGRPPKETLYVDTDGGSTLYVGARASENFGRLYDKGAKEKACPRGSWWRWETELKGRVAVATSDSLVRSDDYRVAIVGEVAHWFARRTGHTYTSSHRLGTLVGPRQPSTVDRQLKWLATGVRPTVAALIDQVGVERVLNVLGLPPQSVVHLGNRKTSLKEA